MDAQTPGSETTSETPVTETDEKVTPETTSGSVEPTEEKASEDELGDAGKKALKAERDARKAAESELKELKAEVSRLRRSNAAVKGTDVEAIKSEIRAEYAAQLAETAIKAEAKGRMNDPADALLYIRAADIDTSDDDAVKAAVDKLLADKPYLAVQSGPKPWGDVGGGQRETPEPEPKSALDRMVRAYGTSNR